MIPKKIHYCWFGHGPKDHLFEKCLKSWKEFFPDWEIIEWNEDNFNINFTKYTQTAYDTKMYAFVSDVARLKIIYDEGGIYFDTDVEVIKKFDKRFLVDGYFGEEEIGLINTGLGFAAPRHNKAIKTMLDSYNNLDHYESTILNMARKYDYKFDSISIENIKLPQPQFPCPLLNTSVLVDAGYKIKAGKEIAEIPIYSPEYFCGFDYRNHRLNTTKNTYSIHHYNASWMDAKQRRNEKMRRKVASLISPDSYERLKKIKRKLIKKNEK